MNNVMVDLETLGIAPGSVILSIGAVYFDEYTTGKEFYVEINQMSSVDAGFQISEDTAQWWSTQPEAARGLLSRVISGGESVATALSQFTMFCMDSDKGIELWGNGASFDNSLLAEAYRVMGMPTPWKFWNDRCHRTLKNLFPEVQAGPFEGTAHHALHDALNQARHASAILRRKNAMQKIARGINDMMRG